MSIQAGVMLPAVERVKPGGAESLTRRVSRQSNTRCTIGGGRFVSGGGDSRPGLAASSLLKSVPARFTGMAVSPSSQFDSLHTAAGRTSPLTMGRYRPWVPRRRLCVPQLPGTSPGSTIVAAGRGVSMCELVS